MIEPILRGLRNRLLQSLARTLPGSQTIRVMLHRARGVHIGNDVFISQDVILETSYPHLITIEDRAVIGIRVTVIAHMRELQGVKIERDAFVGPGVIILPNVIVGHGAVVTAGSVVTRSVPPMTVVQGNPAIPVATCKVPLTAEITVKEFSRQLKPLARRTSNSAPVSDQRASEDIQQGTRAGTRAL
jgi:carbonic anhydrase/acetyltransferase-like protein (isoleucine patch superfamily)